MEELNQLFFRSLIAFLFFFLRILNSHLAILQSIEGFGQDDSRTEDNLCLLDEGIVVVFFGEGTLSAEGNLERAKFTQTDDFAILITRASWQKHTLPNSLPDRL